MPSRHAIDAGIASNSGQYGMQKTRRERVGRVEAWTVSGQTQVEFAVKHRIMVHSLR